MVEEHYGQAVEKPEKACIRLRTLSVRACWFLASLHKGRYTGSERVGMKGLCVCVCACTPSDETLPLLCVYGRFLRAWLSCYGDPVGPCVLTCLLSILFSKIAYIDCLLQVDGNVLPLFSALAASELLQPCLVSAPLCI